MLLVKAGGIQKIRPRGCFKSARGDTGDLDPIVRPREVVQTVLFSKRCIS
jgi:hypothetical protein